MYVEPRANAIYRITDIYFEVFAIHSAFPFRFLFAFLLYAAKLPLKSSWESRGALLAHPGGGRFYSRGRKSILVHLGPTKCIYWL